MYYTKFHKSHLEQVANAMNMFAKHINAMTISELCICICCWVRIGLNNVYNLYIKNKVVSV